MLFLIILLPVSILKGLKISSSIPIFLTINSAPLSTLECEGNSDILLCCEGF